MNIDISTIIAIVAAVIAVAAIVITLISTTKLKDYLSDSDSKHGFGSRNGDIREEIIDVVQHSMRIQQALTTNQTPAKTIVQKAELSTENFNAIVDTVIIALEEKLSKNNNQPFSDILVSPVEEPIATPEEEKPADMPVYTYKYATSYDVKKKTFYKVEERPSDDTIYELAIDSEVGNAGLFTIYKYAYKKVTECQDFLEGACDVSGAGVNIQIIEKGSVSLEDGKWTVDKPLEMKFV